MSDEKNTPADQGQPVDDATVSEANLSDALSRARSGDLTSPEGDETASSGAHHDLPSANPVDDELSTEITDASPSAVRASTGPVEESASANAVIIEPLETLSASQSLESETVVSDTIITTPEGSEEILTVRADHPMAPLYVQAPVLPDMRGNRGAGAWITVLATLGFAAVYAGVIAAILAPTTTASAFVETLTDHLLTPLFFAPVAGFFIGLLILVLIVNRAGWWAYVLGGFLVGVLVYGAAVAGLIFSEALTSLSPSESLDRLDEFLLSPFTILAGVAAREVSVWFGAWIAARGRKVKRANAEELAEYETRLAASPLADQVGI
ncbi:hypothetical protein [Lysinibacter cavernae]|uniref:Uncharacterized protein n=1 Tax=Lysinibacter cavernae TaxID=1640652 RepID=A0A7X5R213_9MICO|nr:hypothetical protein [Lysinibacter cavernae]NIH54225.1 hypothetical protein [Lysinibacter cavernae]